MQELSEEFGIITYVKLKRKFAKSTMRKYYAFVTFSSAESARAAIDSPVRTSYLIAYVLFVQLSFF